jgi:hypothetical protein
VLSVSHTPVTRLLGDGAVLRPIRLHGLQRGGVLGLGGEVLDDVRHRDDGNHRAPEVRLHLCARIIAPSAVREIWISANILRVPT